MSVNSVVRVATNNNFNCTAAEFKQLDKIAAENPGRLFFVNCNARTPKLRDLLKHPYETVITMNPDLNIKASVVERALAVHTSVAFYRVKWLPERPDIAELIERVSKVAPVVVTAQRFNSKKMLQKYTSLEHYKHECSRYRLHGAALEALEGFVDALQHKGRQVYICDRKGLGCLGCGLCATLNGHEGARIESLNLSTSGVCPYNCPDCYAKQMQKFVVACGNAPMQYDKIKRNKKQSGATKHIKNAREAA
jgi:hypothetical protein